MGYYTHYTMTTEPEDMWYDIRHELIPYWGPVDEENIETELKWGLGGGDGAKWYEWETEIRAASHKFPDVLIIIDGDGEGDGPDPDNWRAFIKDGKVEIHKQEKWVPPDRPSWETDGKI